VASGLPPLNDIAAVLLQGWSIPVWEDATTRWLLAVVGALFLTHGVILVVILVRWMHELLVGQLSIQASLERVDRAELITRNAACWCNEANRRLGQRQVDDKALLRLLRSAERAVDSPRLTKLAKAGDPDIAVCAIFAMTREASGPAEMALSVLISLLESPEPKVRFAASWSLSRMLTISPHLLGAFQLNSVPAVRAIGVRTAGLLAQKHGPPIGAMLGGILRDSLFDPDESVRLSAVEAFRRFFRQSEASRLIAHLLQDPVEKVRIETIRALRGPLDPCTTTCLVNCLIRGSRTERRAVIIGCRNALLDLPTLKQHLNATDRRLRAATVRLLGTTRNPVALTLLLPLLQADQIIVRRNAAKALADLLASLYPIRLSPEAWKILFQALISETDYKTQMALLEAIAHSGESRVLARLLHVAHRLRPGALIDRLLDTVACLEFLRSVEPRES